MNGIQVLCVASASLWSGNAQQPIRVMETRMHVKPVYAGVRETNFNDRAFSMKVYAPSRTVGIYARIPEQSKDA